MRGEADWGEGEHTSVDCCGRRNALIMRTAAHTGNPSRVNYFLWFDGPFGMGRGMKGWGMGKG